MVSNQQQTRTQIAALLGVDPSDAAAMRTAFETLLGGDEASRDTQIENLSALGYLSTADVSLLRARTDIDPAKYASNQSMARRHAR